MIDADVNTHIVHAHQETHTGKMNVNVLKICDSCYGCFEQGNGALARMFINEVHWRTGQPTAPSWHCEQMIGLYG